MCFKMDAGHWKSVIEEMELIWKPGYQTIVDVLRQTYGLLREGDRQMSYLYIVHVWGILLDSPLCTLW